MDDHKSQATEIEANERRSIAQGVESLFEGAAEASARAANCNDADKQKFHRGTATAYEEWALQMEPLVAIQARIDEQVAMIRRRFKLGPLRKAGNDQQLSALGDAMNCLRCQDTRWVCEEHPDKPMGHDGCKDAGDPCPVCNPASADKLPALPPGFEVAENVAVERSKPSDDKVIDMLERVGRKRWHK